VAAPTEADAAGARIVLAWTKTADEILDNLAACCTRLNDSAR
jgi:hypothetical protein